ncbi:MAG: hypothetical protein KDD60_00535, partial [Bdellovibrionales bacterium]|nr:hypothetical protein [Bdellovibrionales bacterium]
HFQCARSLPMASPNDIVVLSAPIDSAYVEWLHNLGLSTKHIVSYNQTESPRLLTDLILENPKPIQQALQNVGNNAIYVPFYCSNTDIDCARRIGVPAFGCDEEVTRKYFNKVSFKEKCKELNIPMVDGSHHDIDPESPFDQEMMAEVVSRLLSNYGTVLIRGAEDSNTRSFFLADSPDIQDLYEKLVENQDTSVLIEPFLNVISSPNAQWCIDLHDEIHFIGITAQQFQGFKWAGNMAGQYYSARVYDYMKSTSRLIVEQMRDHGYRGIIGIDYIVCEEGIFPIENNARLTGSTFAMAITERVKKKIPNINCWKFFKAKTDPCTFEELKKDIGHILYDGKKTNSVFPFLTDLLETKGTFIAHLLAEDMYHIDFLQEALSLRGIHRK